MGHDVLSFQIAMNDVVAVQGLSQIESTMSPLIMCLRIIQA